jgi:hypothetical protein
MFILLGWLLLKLQLLLPRRTLDCVREYFLTAINGVRFTEKILWMASQDSALRHKKHVKNLTEISQMEGAGYERA